MLAGRRRTVVTGTTGSEHLRMVDGRGRGESDRAVAVLADVGRLDMKEVFAGRGGAVMTGDASIENAGVIEPGRYPGRGRVAIVALVAR